MKIQPVGNTAHSTIFLIMMRALRAFGFKEKFKKNCASAGNVMGNWPKNPGMKKDSE